MLPQRNLVKRACVGLLSLFDRNYFSAREPRKSPARRFTYHSDGMADASLFEMLDSIAIQVSPQLSAGHRVNVLRRRSQRRSTIHTAMLHVCDDDQVSVGQRLHTFRVQEIRETSYARSSASPPERRCFDRSTCLPPLLFTAATTI